jgi:hypothetical protein
MCRPNELEHLTRLGKKGFANDKHSSLWVALVSYEENTAHVSVALRFLVPPANTKLGPQKTL